MTNSEKHFYIGTAGWNIPASYKDVFPEDGSHLERYARNFNSVEINTSFYRDHKAETYAKWAEATPEDFRFSVKLSRHFTQNTRLTETGDRLKTVLKDIAELGPKWGALLVQLPPSLFFEAKIAEPFLEDLRKFYSGVVLWEPRNQSWCSEKAIELLTKYHISKVHADPEPCVIADEIQYLIEDEHYYRLHGAPQLYRSKYDTDFIHRLADDIKSIEDKSSWVIFDNTELGYAIDNALELKKLLALEAKNSISQ